MKKVAVLLVVLLLLSSLVGCGGGTSSSGSSGSGSQNAGTPSEGASTPSESTSGGEAEFDGEITIGVLIPITGSSAQNGVMITNGIQMAVEKVNDAGGIQGKKVVLVIEDSDSIADTAINGMNKLLANDKISAIIGPILSLQVFAVEANVARYDVPVVHGGTNLRIPALGNKQMFSGRANDMIVAKAAARYLVETYNPKKVAILATTEDYGAGGMEVASTFYDEIGQDYIIEQFDGSIADLTGVLLNVKNAGCDAILNWTLGGWLVMARQLYEQGLDQLPIIGGPGTSDQNTLKLMQPEWYEGNDVACDFVPSSTAPLAAAFVEAFEKRMNLPPDNVAASYYSMADMLLHAMMEYTTDATNREQVREALLQVDGFESVVGTFYANPTTQQLYWQTNIAKFVNGELTFIERVDGR